MNSSNRFNKHLLSSFCMLFFFIVLAPATGQDKHQQIDELLQMYQDYHQFNGSALVAEKGKVIFKKGFGKANMEWQIPNAADTKHRLGSISKQFTAALILKLAAAGKIDLQAKLSDYLPDYRSDTGDRVTIHQLLSHTSGIPSYTRIPNFFSEISRNPYSVDDFVKSYCSGDLRFEPGTKFEYNNSGYFLLGAVIEELNGKSYAECLQEQIFDPLEMNSSGYDLSSPLIEKRAAGYEKSFDGYRNSDYLDMSLPYAAGSLYSTVEDLYTWDRALYTDKVLPIKWKRLFFKPAVRTGPGNHYAYGWSIRKQSVGEDSDSLLTISHGGGINGFNTLINRYTEEQHLVVLLNNTGGTVLNQISTGIMNILHGKAWQKPRRDLARIMYKKIQSAGMPAAISEYRKLKKAGSDEYRFNPGLLNNLGYQLLSNDMLEMAVEIFKLNTTEYPENANAWDSLGEGYKIQGNKELAIQNYAKSLQLDPGNSNAIQMLQEINKAE